MCSCSLGPIGWATMMVVGIGYRLIPMVLPAQPPTGRSLFISAGLLVPYAYVAHQGYGLFLFDGPDGWKLPAGILVWHLIYGLLLFRLLRPLVVRS